MATNDKQIIFSLIGVGRVHPPKKHVLKDIYLSFYYGAKIGVLGLNGSGKSSLLRIIAGVDQDYIGKITMSKGYTVGSTICWPPTRRSGCWPTSRSAGTSAFTRCEACAATTPSSIAAT